jgi:ribosomal protein S18 acetylase RimI-like enzyme
MHLEVIQKADDDLVRVFAGLIPQLTDRNAPPGLEALQAIVASPATHLLAARISGTDDPICGLLALVIYRIPTGVRARIEDLVVDQDARRRGVGQALIQEALRMAREAGANGVSLTSNPDRQAANRLYRQMGFQPHETNLYFYPFPSSF